MADDKQQCFNALERGPFDSHAFLAVPAAGRQVLVFLSSYLLDISVLQHAKSVGMNGIAGGELMLRRDAQCMKMPQIRGTLEAANK